MRSTFSHGVQSFILDGAWCIRLPSSLDRRRLANLNLLKRNFQVETFNLPVCWDSQREALSKVRQQNKLNWRREDQSLVNRLTQRVSVAERLREGDCEANRFHMNAWTTKGVRLLERPDQRLTSCDSHAVSESGQNLTRFEWFKKFKILNF